MPILAVDHQVIAVDIRGMGTSDQPPTGYDKKTMAGDVHELLRHLGHPTVNLAGHDMGASVAFALTANYPHAVRRLALLDGTHPDEAWYKIPLLPQPGVQTDALAAGAGGGYLWWFAFNQVRGLPEQLLAGRARLLIDWVVDVMAQDPKAIDDRDREIYAHAYDSRDAIRASNAWYQAIGQDVADAASYEPLGVPVLVLGTEVSHVRLRGMLAGKATDVRVVAVAGSGHFLAEEQPEFVARQLAEFFA
jgi:pimeloyl-ACP methyl ester carboxylesterase